MNYDSMISTIYDNMSTSKCLQPEGPSGDPFDVHPAHLYGQGVNAVDLGILRFKQGNRARLGFWLLKQAFYLPLSGSLKLVKKSHQKEQLALNFEFNFKFGRCQRLQPASPLTPVVQKDSRSHSPTAPIQNSEAPSSEKNPNHKFQIRLIAYLSTLSTLSTSQNHQSLNNSY